MVTKKGLVGLHSGRQIRLNKGKRGFKITRSQTALEAYEAIIQKYGVIVDSAKYEHRGKGNWFRYSLKRDATRTGNVITDIKKWRTRPNKYDFKGKDTKGSFPGKKAAPKHKTYRYASYNRPAWSSINLGVQHTISAIRETDNYPESKRMPKQVFTVPRPIPQEKIKLLELIDMREVAQMKRLIEYIRTNKKIKPGYVDLLVNEVIERKFIKSKADLLRMFKKYPRYLIDAKGNKK